MQNPPLLHNGAAPDGPVVSPLLLLERQLRALQAWSRALSDAERRVAEPALSREQRLDAARALDVRRREREALLARLAEQDLGVAPMLERVPRTVVVAVRQAHVGGALAKALRSLGLTVLAQVDNGADVVGIAVAEQPTAVVLEDVLAMRHGAETAAQLRRLSPHTVVTGWVDGEHAMAPLREAGARAVWTRRTPTTDVAAGVLALLHAEGAQRNGHAPADLLRPAGPPAGQS